MKWREKKNVWSEHERVSNSFNSRHQKGSKEEVDETKNTERWMLKIEHKNLCTLGILTWFFFSIWDIVHVIEYNYLYSVEKEPLFFLKLDMRRPKRVSDDNPKRKKLSAVVIVCLVRNEIIFWLLFDHHLLCPQQFMALNLTCSQSAYYHPYLSTKWQRFF